MNGEAKALRKYLEKNPNGVLAVRDSDKCSLLHAAASSSQYKTLKVLLQLGSVVDGKHETGATALYLAAQEGFDRGVDLLLSCGANPNSVAVDGATPLYIAAQRGHTKVLQRLLESGADPHILTYAGSSPLYVAAQQGHAKCLEMLISKVGSVNFQFRGTPVLASAISRGHARCARILVNAGARLIPEEGLVEQESDDTLAEELSKVVRDLKSKAKKDDRKDKKPSKHSYSVEGLLQSLHEQACDFEKDKADMVRENSKLMKEIGAWKAAFVALEAKHSKEIRAPDL